MVAGEENGVKYDLGIVKEQKIAMTIDVNVPRDERKMYRDAEAIIKIKTEGFKEEEGDSLTIYDNNLATSKFWNRFISFEYSVKENE